MILYADTVYGFDIKYDSNSRTFIIGRNGKSCRHVYDTMGNLAKLAGGHKEALRWALRDWLMGASIYLLGYEDFCTMFLCDMYNDSVKNSWKRFAHIYNQVKEIMGEDINAKTLDNLITEVEK